MDSGKLNELAEAFERTRMGGKDDGLKRLEIVAQLDIGKSPIQAALNAARFYSYLTQDHYRAVFMRLMERRAYNAAPERQTEGY